MMAVNIGLGRNTGLGFNLKAKLTQDTVAEEGSGTGTRTITVSWSPTISPPRKSCPTTREYSASFDGREEIRIPALAFDLLPRPGHGKGSLLALGLGLDK